MATQTPLGKLQTTDLFLVNRTDTYKVNFADLVSDISIQINNTESISIDGVAGINTELYVSGRANDRTPSTTDLVANFADENGNVLGKDGRNWLLQYMPTTHSNGPAGNTGAGEFVLADAFDLFTEIGDSITGDIELNTLNDVTTTELVGSVLSYQAAVKGDTILIALDDNNGGDVSDPDNNRAKFGYGTISGAVNNLLDKGDINISIEHITEINPNLGGGNPGNGEAPEDAKLIGRLRIRSEYLDGLSTVKYQFFAESLQKDDVLVYIAVPSDDIINYNDPATGAVDENGNVAQLLPGWYPAENSGGSDSNFFDETQVAESPDNNANYSENVGAMAGESANLGVVRVLPRKDTQLVPDTTNGGYKVGPNGLEGDRTNIKITPTGILYSEIPDTLSFIAGVTVIHDGNSVETRIESAAPPLLQPGGPAESSDPTNASSQNGPATGDFYVIVFDDTYANVSDGGQIPDGQDATTVTLSWNTQSPGPNDPVDGQLLTARNGDIIAFGEKYWNIIGNANTDSIRQDLDQVLGEGNTSDMGIVLNAVKGAAAAGILVGAPEDATDNPVDAKGGEVACHTVKAENIDFSMFDDIGNA